ncbi:hypothetical protein [Streptomyces profundus]|uniref:hypothetical protein n=1 Tax=Streptomyces profundus TaxID=2867410 RepID=UPI001D16B8B1|nr:hypothetical protein [Streptomyces sp. MA3_2.13]UED85173.1 hypothetical protein K4G22_14000 [Streptomyces sp. MA3_2.13]
MAEHDLAGDEARPGPGADRVRLPATLLNALLRDVDPASPVVRLALRQARQLPPGPDRTSLLAALLAGPCATTAPDWLLTAAATAEPPHADPRLTLVALSHPDCPPDTREAALRGSADQHLGALAHAGAPESLRAGVVAELRRRLPQRPPAPITPEALDRPDAAQLLLRSTDLADEVFDAAIPLLPGPPAQLTEGEELRDWVARHGAALAAWRTMWRRVLTAHPARYARLLTLLDDEQAETVVHQLLLGALPWTVDPELLVALAEDDLERFAGAALTTRICQLLLAGHSSDETTALVADDLDALPARDRRLPLAYLGEFGATPERGLRTASDWVARAVTERWGPLLTAEDSHTWRTPPETRAALRERFALTALRALELWRPRPDFPLCRPEQIDWLRTLARELPPLRGALRERATDLLADAERGRRHRRLRRGAYPVAEDRAFDQSLTELRELLGVGWRGLPQDPSLTELAFQPAGVLSELVRDGAPDALVERLLLGHAVRGYRSGPAFAELLATHSAPTEALRRLTEELPDHLGDHPGAEETWAKAVLASGTGDARTIRALPALAALRAPAPEPGAAGPTVLSVITEALGDDADAWHRFATGPLRAPGGLRLGTALDLAGPDRAP